MRESQIPVGCVQLLAHDRAGFERRWPSVLALTDAAGGRGARLIVLPEGTVPAYVLGDEPISVEQLASAQRDLSALAQRHRATIVYGGAKIVGGRVFNAAIAIGPDGSELGYAAKAFLWHFDRRWYAPGNTLEPIDTPLGRLGLLVCADGRIPTIPATLVERGARMLVMPTAWVTSGRDPGALENIQADLMVNVRARENGVPFVTCNKAGVELAAVAYCGKSTIVDATGETLARGSERSEEIVFAHVAPGKGARASRELSQHGTTPHRSSPAKTARIGFTPERDDATLERFTRFAAHADYDLIVSASSHGSAGDVRTLGVEARGDFDADIVDIAGLRIVVVGDAVLRHPRGLLSAHAAGADLVVWDVRGDERWALRFARTRAAELRAYVVLLDRESKRAFAVDPDGIVVAGTFDGYRLASFVYDSARTAATLVAPSTDVADGLRAAEAMRAEGLVAPLADSPRR